MPRKSRTLGTSVVDVPVITILIANVLNEWYPVDQDVYEIALFEKPFVPGANAISR